MSSYILPLYTCRVCKKNGTIGDFIFYPVYCNEHTPPMFHCRDCGHDSKNKSEFMKSDIYCNKCFMKRSNSTSGVKR
jgi:hypothetical protein